MKTSSMKSMCSVLSPGMMSVTPGLSWKSGVTREMVYARTRELARISNRAPHEICQLDYERAKRELTGESDSRRQDEILDSMEEKEKRRPLALAGKRIKN